MQVGLEPGLDDFLGVRPEVDHPLLAVALALVGMRPVFPYLALALVSIFGFQRIQDRPASNPSEHEPLAMSPRASAGPSRKICRPLLYKRTDAGLGLSTEFSPASMAEKSFDEHEECKQSES